MQGKTTINIIRHINVPLTLLQQSRQDQLEWSLAALATAIKMYSPSSCFILTSVNKLCRTFHIGYRKAQNLLAAIGQGHRLFATQRRDDGTLLITARSFRKAYGYYATFSHRHERYNSLCMVAVAINARTRHNLRISDIEHEMRLRLMQSVINAKNRADELKTKGCPTTGSTSHADAVTLSIPLLARVTGRSQRQVIRLSQKAQAQGDIRVTQYPLERCCDDLNRATYDVSSLIHIGTVGFRRNCNDYQILQRQLRQSFKHIIYAHRSRWTHNVCTLLPGQTLSQSVLHELQD